MDHKTKGERMSRWRRNQYNYLVNLDLVSQIYIRRNKQEDYIVVALFSMYYDGAEDQEHSSVLLITPSEKEAYKLLTSIEEANHD